MPQFELNENTPLDVDAFTQGYIEAMFFTNGDTGDENDNRLNELGTGRLTILSREAIKSECHAFQRDNAGLLSEAYGNCDYEPERAGADFWFTRQGHGVGYWDRAELAPPAMNGTCRSLGELLTDAAKRYGESYVEIDRGWIYYR